MMVSNPQKNSASALFFYIPVPTITLAVGRTFTVLQAVDAIQKHNKLRYKTLIIQ